MTIACPLCAGSGKAPEHTAYRTARHAAGDPMRVVAQSAGVSIPMIHDVEHGRRKPSPKIADAYRRLYGVG